MAQLGVILFAVFTIYQFAVTGALLVTRKQLNNSQNDFENISPIVGTMNLSCAVSKPELPSLNKPQKSDKGKHHINCSIALLIPTKGNKKSADNLNTTLNSVNASKSSRCDIGMYVAYDADDAWYNQSSNRDALVNSAVAQTGHIYFVVNNAGRSFVNAVNAAAIQAVIDGYNYLYQIGDDILFLTPEWDKVFEQAIIDMDYIGVVGPVQSNMNSKPILQQSFVSREHVCMFGYYFPQKFNNWYTDNWITQLYNYSGKARQINEVHVSNFDNKRYYGDRSSEFFWQKEAENAYCETLNAAILQPTLWNCTHFISHMKRQK